VTNNPHDVGHGEMVAMLRELARVFLRLIAFSFAVLTIATLNGSQMIGG
jgi:hypothetical protein